MDHTSRIKFNTNKTRPFEKFAKYAKPKGSTDRITRAPTINWMKLKILGDRNQRLKTLSLNWSFR